MAVHFEFPYQQAAMTVVKKIEARTSVRIEFEGPRPGWPFSYHLKNIELFLAAPTGAADLFQIDKLSLDLEPLKLLSRRIGARIKVKAAGGVAQGRLDYGLTSDNFIGLKFDRIDMPGFSIAAPQGNGAIEGNLSGSFEISGQNGRIPGSGQGSITIGPGKLSNLKIPNLPLSELDFDAINLEFTLDNNQITLDRLEVIGVQGGLELKGRIRDFKQLRLYLTGQARLGPKEKPLFSTKLRISGTMSKPIVRTTSKKTGK